MAFTYKRTYDDHETFSHFTGLEIDGLWVDASHYTAVAGSVVITLNTDYLETLSVGKHIITAYFDDGNAVTSEFYVSTQQTNQIPRTADDINLRMWTMIEFLSLSVLLVVLHRIRTMED